MLGACKNSIEDFFFMFVVNGGKFVREILARRRNVPFRCPKRELRHLVTSENLWNEHKNVILIITWLEENVEELRCDWCNM